jgi:rhodanese-related sulfurtransferase
MKSMLFILILPVCFVTLSCEGQTTGQKLPPDAFDKKIQASQGKIILDVRTPREFSSGHLPDAVCVDYYRHDFKAQLAKLDKSKPVFVYCATGGRSGSTVKTLSQLGFKEIYDLQGGISAWARAGKPVVP